MRITWPPSVKVDRPVHPVYVTVAASAALLVGALCMSGPDTQTHRTESLSSRAEVKADAKSDASLSVRRPAPDKNKLPGSLPTKDSQKPEPKKKAKAKAEVKVEAKPTPAPERTETTSRSEDRGDINTTDARAWAKTQLSGDQFGCLDALISAESGWRVNASNASSGAYGLPQALPGSKMSSAGADWETNGVTQLKWAVKYIDGRYGSPCGAWSFHQANNWY